MTTITKTTARASGRTVAVTAAKRQPTQLDQFFKVVRGFRKGRKVTGERLREAALETGNFNSVSSAFWGGAVGAAMSRGLLTRTNDQVICKDPVARGRKTAVLIRA